MNSFFHFYFPTTSYIYSAAINRLDYIRANLGGGEQKEHHFVKTFCIIDM